MTVIDVAGRTPAQKDVTTGPGRIEGVPWFASAGEHSLFSQQRVSFAELQRTSAPAQAEQQRKELR